MPLYAYSVNPTVTGDIDGVENAEEAGVDIMVSRDTDTTSGGRQLCPGGD